MDNPTRRIVRDMHAHGEQEHPKQRALQGVDLHSIREMNRLLILDQVRRYGPLARVAIARRLRLSRTTVSSIIDALLQEGLVREGSFLDAAPQGGRRAILVHFQASAGYVLGIDIGRKHLVLMLTNLAADIITYRTFPFDASLGPDMCIVQLIRQMQEFTQEAQLDWCRLIGIGIGMPGPLDAAGRTLSSPAHMPGWNTVDLKQVLYEQFGVPLHIDRDANMGTLGEARQGAGHKHHDMAYIKIGTGIGSGLMLNDQIYRGHNGSAGEIGHLPFDKAGIRCVCGNQGCLETVAATPAIVMDASLGLSLQRNALYTDNSLSSLPIDMPIKAKHTMDEVLLAAREGDPASLAALEHAGECIGVAIAGLINIFNPSVIVIDGGVALEDEIFLQALRRVATKTSLPAAMRDTRILAGKLGKKAVALGAAITVIEEAFALPIIGNRKESSRESEARAMLVRFPETR
jgi:glucokinase-like ROK family protein